MKKKEKYYYLLYSNDYGTTFVIQVLNWKRFDGVIFTRTGYHNRKEIKWNRSFSTVEIGDFVYGSPELSIKNIDGRNVIYNNNRKRIEYDTLMCECTEAGKPIGLHIFDDKNTAELYFRTSTEWKENEN